MRAVFTLVTIIFIICVSVTVTSFREIPLWRLEAQPEKLPNFLDDESVHNDQDAEATNETKLLDSETSDKMTKTSSYGAMGNEQQLDVPPVHVSIAVAKINRITSRNYLYHRTISDDIQCRHCQRIQSMPVYPEKMPARAHSIHLQILSRRFRSVMRKESHHCPIT